MQDPNKPTIDRTGWFAIVLLGLGLFIYLNWSGKQSAMRMAERAEAARIAEEQAAENLPADVPAATEDAGPPTMAGAGALVTAPPADANANNNAEAGSTAPEAPTAAPEATATLVSGPVEFILTTNGGGVKIARLLDHTRTVDSDELVVLNDYGLAPIGSLATNPGNPLVDQFTILSQNDDTVVMEGRRADGLVVTKTFRVPATTGDRKADAKNGSRLDLDIKMVNRSAAPIQIGDSYLYVGATRRIDKAKFAAPPSFVRNDDHDTKSIKETYFKDRKLGETRTLYEARLERPLWAGTMNRFFLTLVSPKVPSPTRIWAKRFSAPMPYQPTHKELTDGTTGLPKTEPGLVTHGGIYLPEMTLPRDVETSTPFQYEIYAGAKEYKKLKDSGHDRDKGMFYGWGIFGWVSTILANIITFFHGLVDKMDFVHSIGAWGIAIILMTIALRFVMWPLHAKSAKSMKRMSLLAPKMEELKKKYTDEPQKMQMETMKLYKRYGVNPVGGCLPMFFQLPIFIGFYRMLQSSAELRGEKFLWVNDLSQPDTAFYLFGFPINPLPLLMAVTMFLQFAVAPKTGDKNQRMIFMMMPVIFLFMCYSFASGLALYWTTSNIFTIFQTLVTKLQPDPILIDREEEARLAAAKDKSVKKTAPRTGGTGPSSKKKKKK